MVTKIWYIFLISVKILKYGSFINGKSIILTETSFYNWKTNPINQNNQWCPNTFNKERQIIMKFQEKL